MPEALTREKVASHVATAGACCPFCGSGDLEPQGYGSRDYGVLDWKIYCNACGETYTELYQLTGLDTDDETGSVDLRDVVVALLKQEPIFILLEGGIVQDVGVPKGLAGALDVVVMDVDARDFAPSELTGYSYGRGKLAAAHFYTPVIWSHTDCGVCVRTGEMTDVGRGYPVWREQQEEEAAETVESQAGRSLLQTGPPDLEESLDDVE